MDREYLFSMRDHMNAAASLVGMEGWEAYSWEASVGGSVVKGCVPSGVYTRGPSKGRPKFRPATPGTERVVVVADSHMTALAIAYEAESGKCWDCKGSGETWAGWSAESGHKTRTCRRCNGAGTAKEPQP